MVDIIPYSTGWQGRVLATRHGGGAAMDPPKLCKAERRRRATPSAEWVFASEGRRTHVGARAIPYNPVLYYIINIASPYE